MIRYVLNYIKLLSFICLPLASAGQIHIMIDVPSAGQLSVSDLWKLQVISESKDSLTIRLEGSITGLDKGLIYKAMSSAIRIYAGEKKSLTVQDVGPITLIHPDTIRTGLPVKLPPGNFRLCIRAINARTSEVSGNDCIQVNMPSLRSPSQPASMDK